MDQNVSLSAGSADYPFDALHWDRSDSGERTFLSTQSVRWPSVLVEEVRSRPEAEVILPATRDFQLVVVAGGRATIESRQGNSWRRATYVSGTVSMTAPGRPTFVRWRAESEKPLRTIHVTLPRPTMERAMAQLGFRQTIDELAPDSLAVSDQLIAASLTALRSAAERQADPLYADAAAWHLAMHLLVRGARRPQPAPAIDDPRMKQVVAYIHDNLGAPLTLTDIAASAGLSPFHLVRTFHSATGQTPYRYVLTARLKMTRDRLARTAAPIGEIALEAGFNSSSHFAAAFRSRYGLSPSQFRAESEG